ncbi:putative DNA ligase [Lactobacillus phage LpeD]|uniref:Putative DNA ligase n=1 Tax=Lactobacillus phage LpeD TaxID=2041210 RepID=A0A291I9M2_9CAUD|nr:RNA ligase [Lactobacillus phage LpeD]ATG86390.1 putative DNA ligase [Lactobacillus phage LpeD]
MQKFQKIKSYENEKMFEDKLANNGKEVITIEPTDSLIITEKMDGSNASVTIEDGKLVSYSHNCKLDENKTLNGFYGFINSIPNLNNLPEKYILFGEWLTPHRIVYKPECYNKWYLFDLFDKENNEFLGYKAAQKVFVDLKLDEYDILMAPLLEDEITNITFNDLPRAQEAYSEKSDNSVRGNMEGIVVSDLSKTVPTSETTTGPLRVKLVNAVFKETKQLPKDSINVSEWLNANITLPRISKKILEMQDEDNIKNEKPNFGWMHNGYSHKIALEVLIDALEESPELPAELKQVLQVSKSQTNKFIALTAKDLI